MRALSVLYCATLVCRPTDAMRVPLIQSIARRSLLHSLGHVGIMATVQPVWATCSCPTGIASCVCTEDAADYAGPKVKRRADAAGRDAVAAKIERKELEAFVAEQESGRRRKEPPPRRPPPDTKQLSSDPTAGQSAFEAPVVSRMGLSGGGSQNFGEMNAQVWNEA
jgi:hypothetical protein